MMALRDGNRKELRKNLEGLIPNDLNTDFQMDRWLDSYDDNVEKCAEKFKEYLLNRKACGYDNPEFIKTFLDQPEVQRHNSIFAQSRPHVNWVNHKDNGIVFVECCVADGTKTTKSLRVGDFLRIFFGYCEFFLQLVLENEKRTGKRSYVVCIFDMKDMSILQYINPVAPINKMFEARVNIWMDYYGESLKNCVIVNPPRLLSALMKVMSMMLPSRMMSRFHIAQSPEDIAKVISRNAIPVGYGGEMTFEKPYLPSGFIQPKELTKEDFIIEGQVWQKHKIAVTYENHTVSAGESYTTKMQAKKGQTLLYEYLANRNFEVLLIKDGKDYLLPRFRMSSPLVSEEGEIPIKEDCEISMEVKNLSRMLRMKLKIALKLVT